MKRISLIANIVLAVAVVALYVLYFTGTCNQKSTGVVHTEAASEIPSGAIVYIQIDSLINGLDLYHALKTDLEAKVKVVENDLNKKMRAFENDAAKYTNDVQKGLITRSQAETQGTQLEQRQRELQQFSQQKQMELAEEEQVMLNNVLNEIKSFLSIYNEEHGFSLILATSGAPGTILAGDASIDITKDVLNRLNAKYAEQRTKKK